MLLLKMLSKTNDVSRCPPMSHEKKQCAANTDTYRGTYTEERQKEKYNFSMAFCE